ncbi:MAG: large conductance mechanosensitive channel protein MscL [Lautropia sp.]
MGMMSEFRDFAIKGNVVDLAVGVIIGGAFGKIVDSIVKDLIMPIVGAIFGGLDFSNYFIPLAKVPDGVAKTYDALNKAGIPMFAYGNFITILLNFLILAFIIFQMVRVYQAAKNRMVKEEAKAPPAAPPEDVVLLREIRDSLKRA